MIRILTLIVAVTASCIAGCETPRRDPCSGVTCGGNGVCVSDGIAPRCACNDGYRPSGLDCVPIGADGDADDGGDGDADGDGDAEVEGGSVCGNGIVEPPEECDDDPPPTRACTTSCGSTGTETCALGCRWSGRCDPPVEACNGVDDDCDTEVDEGYPCIRGRVVTCATTCGSTGRGTCTSACGIPAGAACTPPAEACNNGADDDCDTETDELTPEQCRPGTVVSCATSCSTTGTGTCTDGCSPPLPAACTPPAELCNAADDDCDGETDETFACRMGAAVACTTTCSTTGSGACTSACAIPTGAACRPPAELCNAADDDCDGSTDETFACVRGATVPCTTTCGSTGAGTCTSACGIPTGAACTPPAEVCGNGVDDDCDGATDEGCGGGRIVFVSNRSGRYEVWAMNDDGSGLRQMSFAAPTATRYEGAFSPRWSPDGTKIAFIYATNYPPPGRSSQLVVVNADGTGTRVVSSAFRSYTPQISWTADGTEVLVNHDNVTCDWQILAINVTTGASRVVVENSTDGYTNPGYPDGHPTDANLLCYMPYNCGGSYGGLRSRNIGTGVDTTIRPPPEATAALRWSPAADRVLWTTIETSTSPFFYTVAATGGAGTTITPSPAATNVLWADWTAAGFVYSDEPGGTVGEIWTCGPTGSGAVRLTTDSYHDTQPDWHPGRLPAVPTWTAMTSPTTGELQAVSMISATDGWAVGSAASDAVFVRWNGTVWTVVPVSVPRGTLGTTATDVKMLSTTAGWAVGYGYSGGTTCNSWIYRWDGSSWNAFPYTSPYGNDRFMRLFFLGAGSGWLVGGPPYQRGIHRWNGTAWSASSFPGGDSCNPVFAVSETDAWTSCSNPTVTRQDMLRWNGTSWTLFHDDYYGDYMMDIWMISATDGWMVGRPGKIMRWTGGTSWTDFASPTSAFLRAIEMVGSTDGWIVGEGGTILKWNGTAWTPVAPSPTTAHLYDIDMLSATEGFAVGANGTILRFASPWGTTIFSDDFSSGAVPDPTKWGTHNFTSGNRGTSLIEVTGGRLHVGVSTTRYAYPEEFGVYSQRSFDFSGRRISIELDIELRSDFINFPTFIALANDTDNARPIACCWPAYPSKTPSLFMSVVPERSSVSHYDLTAVASGTVIALGSTPAGSSPFGIGTRRVRMDVTAAEVVVYEAGVEIMRAANPVPGLTTARLFVVHFADQVTVEEFWADNVSVTIGSP